MRELTVTVELPGLRRKVAAAQRANREASQGGEDIAASSSDPAELAADSWRPARLARMLALSYLIDELVQSGQARNYAEVALRLGVTGARVAQILNLRWVPAVEQEAILGGTRGK